MAELCLLNGIEFRESFFNFRKIEKRIVAKSIATAWRVEDHALCFSLEHRERSAIACCRDPTHEPARASFHRHCSNLTNQLCIVGFVIGVRFSCVWLVGGIPCRMHSWSAAQSIHLKPGVIGNNQLSW